MRRHLGITAPARQVLELEPPAGLPIAVPAMTGTVCPVDLAKCWRCAEPALEGDLGLCLVCIAVLRDPDHTAPAPRTVLADER